jgi:DNA-binding response OmpR family regulator
VTCSVCPRCGYALEALEAFTLGSLGVEASGAAVWWSGHPVPLTTAERLVLIAIVRAGGNTVTRDVLAECEGYDGDRPENNTNVLVHRIKKAFLAIDRTFDRIETVRGQGIRWRMA